jgi:antitoxin Phd
MVKTISTAAARANFGDVLNSVFYTKEPVVVEKKGRPVAVIVSPELFQRLQEEDERDWAIIEAVSARNADKDPDEILAEVTAIVEEVRQERYERQQGR